jgi:quercetin dioxygenase-like cupin family protein
MTALVEPCKMFAKVKRLESVLCDLPQIDIPVTHVFGPGFYARTVTIPAGSILVGKLHATDHIFIVSSGTLMLTTDDAVMMVEAPFQCVAKAGMKRAGHAITDVVCTNVHITTETDLVKLENQLIVNDAIEFDQHKEVIQWGG